MYQWPLATTGAWTILSAGFVGLFLYDNFSYYGFIYDKSRTYQDTVPSQPAASVADAGRLVFAPEAYIDQSEAVGYAASDGHKYCIAPIRDLTDSPIINFWAVGYDCCEWQGSFACDAADDGTSGDGTTAHGGIVVFDSDGPFALPSNRDRYEKAQRKSEATFDLQSVDKPVYARWVKTNNLDMVSNWYKLRCWLFMLLATLLWAIISSLMALVMHNMHYQKAMQTLLS